MRIFYAVPDTPYEGYLNDSKLWYANLYLPLIDLGHDVISFNYDYGPVNCNLDPTIPAQQEFIRQNRPLFSEELLKQVKAAHRTKPIDLFFSYFYSSYVEPDAIREIGAMGIPTINWYCNASYQFHLVEEIAPAYDYCLVPEKFRLNDYRQAGANPVYCQEAANPNVYKPYDVPVEFDVVFVGQKYGNRPMYINSLIEAGVDVRVWGPHWQASPKPVGFRKRTKKLIKQTFGFKKDGTAVAVPPAYCGPPLSDEAYIKKYSQSKISLGFSVVGETALHDSPIRQVRLRDFEAPMSGAFYLAEYFEELTEFFEPGKEIVCFTDPDDLIEKVHYYLSHESERQRIQEAGLRRARNEHTWHKRFEAVFREIGLT